MQSGKPVGVFQTHPGAPRVLIANALLVPAWATWENFRDLEQRGLTMYGQMTAGSWIYIGSQGIVQGTYETLAAVGRRHFGGTLSGRLVVTAGLGGMGGAQPLAATMNGAAALVVEVDPQRIARRLATRYLDEATDSLDEALDAVGRWTRDRVARSIGAARQRRRRAAGARRPRRHARRADRSDVGARRARTATCPTACRSTTRTGCASATRPDYVARSMAAMAEHVRAMLALQARGAVTFDYGNNIRAQAQQAGVANAFDIPGFVPEYIRPLFCEGKGPFRWVALSGDPEDIRVTDDAALEMFAAQRGAGALDSPGARARARSRDCPRASSGSATASARASGCASTSWCARAGSRRRSSSAAIISTPDRSPRPTARPKACWTAATRSPTGRS